MSHRKYTLPDRERRRLHGRAYRAQQRDHSEVCGFLVSDSLGRLRLWFVKNQSNRPYEYSIDRRVARSVSRLVARQNLRVLGTFHSHPISTAVPSTGDLKRGFLKGIELIYDVCGRRPRLWRVRKLHGVSMPEEVPLFLESRSATKRSRPTPPLRGTELLSHLLGQVSKGTRRGDFSRILREGIWKTHIVKEENDRIEVADLILHFDGDSLARVSLMDKRSPRRKTLASARST